MKILLLKYEIYKNNLGCDFLFCDELRFLEMMKNNNENYKK